MRTPFAKRLAQALAAHEGKEGQIAAEAGVSAGQLSRWKNATEEEGPVPLASAVEGLLRAMPRLNGHWLVTGDGDMWLPTGDEALRLRIAGKVVAGRMGEALIELLPTLRPALPEDVAHGLLVAVLQGRQEASEGTGDANEEGRG